jgi:transposase InsO family protein
MNDNDNPDHPAVITTISVNARIAEYREILQGLMQELLEKQVHYDELRRRTPAVSRAEKESAKQVVEDYRTDVELAKATLDTLVSSSSALEVAEISPVSGNQGSLGSSMIPSNSAERESHKKVQRIRIRPFRPDVPGKTPDDFWNYFLGVGQNHRLNFEESVLLLANACDEGRGLNWYRLNFYETKGLFKNLDEVKDSFYAAFLSPNWKQDRYFALLLLLWKEGETVAGYFERFSLAASGYETSVVTTEPAQATFLKDLFWYHMPVTVRRALGSRNHQADFDSCQDLFVFLNHAYPGAPPDVWASQKAVRDLLKKAISPAIPDSRRPTKKSFCTHCNVSSHATEECRKRKAMGEHPVQSVERSNRDKPFREKDFDAMRVKGICYRCGTPYEGPKHQCVKKDDPKYGKNLILKRVFLDVEDSQASHLEDLNVMNPVLSALKFPNDHAKFLKAPVLLNGTKVLGGIDTYASHSFMSPTLVQELQLKIVPVTGTIILGAAEKVVERIGRVHDVNISVLLANGSIQEVQHSFDVLDMGEGCNCLMGLDLLPKIGITVGNIPREFPDISSTLKDKVEADDLKPTQNIVDETDPLLPLARKAAWEALDSIDVEKAQYNKNVSYYLSLFREQLKETILTKLLKQNEAIDDLCSAANAEVPLDTSNDDPINIKQYRINFKLRPVVDEQINKWLKKGIIRKLSEHVNWNTPIVIVPKRDLDSTVKGWRVCLDLRHVNQLIKSVHYPLPLIKDILESLSGSSVFSRLDLQASFNQIKLKTRDQIKTAFTWAGTQYCFVGVPFGLKHISSVFQKIMHTLLGHLEFVKCFVDDIIIHSRSHEEHIQHLKTVLEILNANNLIVNTEKCIFAVHEIVILGHQINRRGISLAADKLLALDSWTLPKTGKQLGRHLGFFNYFRDLIPLYSKLTEPLDKLRTASSLESLWTVEHTKIYEKLKQIMLSKILLHYPNFSKPFCVATDASSRGLGGCLYQLDDHGTPQFISFASRSLTPGEGNYGATQRELLGIIFCLKHFEYYLYGSHFQLFTDHRALSFLFSQKKLSPHVKNWMETLMSFDFDVIYRPGVLNILPDRISRLYDEDPDPIQNDVVVWSIPAITSEEATNASTVTPEKRKELLETQHLLGHFGTDQIIKPLIHQGLYWPSMRMEARELVKACIPCQRYNIGRHGFHPLKSITADLPLDHMAMDLKEMPQSRSHYKFILVLVDVFTRFVFLRPIKKKAAKTVASNLFHIFCDIGFPKILQSDNGKEFVNLVNQEFSKVSRIERRMITPYHARGNGLAEKMVDVCANTLYKLLNGQERHWDRYLPAVQFFVNTKMASTTGSTPYSLMFARAPNHFSTAATSSPMTEEDLQRRLKYLTDVVYPSIRIKIDAVNEKRAELFSRQHRMITEDTFKPGSLVMALDELRANKTAPRYLGPFLVQSRNRGGAYKIKGPDGTVYTRPPSALKLVSPTTPFALESAVVDTILDHKKTQLETLYLVKWKDPSITNEWVPEHAFDDLAPISRYWKHHGQESRPVSSPQEVLLPRIRLKLSAPKM